MTEVPAEYLTSTISEAAFQRTVIEMAHLYGWRAHHTRPARTAKGWRTPIEGDAGFQDLVLAREGLVLFAELKAERGKLTVEQEAWRLAINGPPTLSGPRYCWAYIWRPSDIEEIEQILRVGF